MIDPDNVTNYSLTDAELQEFFLFSIAVAGGNAKQTSKALETLLNIVPDGCVDNYYCRLPFHRISAMIKKGVFRKNVIKARIGKRERFMKGCQESLTHCFSGTVDLRHSKPDALMLIHGVGLKTSRFFCLHTRKDAQCAALDTHILKWLGKQGHRVPKTTPASRSEYARLEEAFLQQANQRGLKPADLDIIIWRAYNQKKPEMVDTQLSLT